MRFLLNRRLHINMGNYEHIEDVATVEVDTEKDAEVLVDHGVNPAHPEEVREFIWNEVAAFLAPGIEQAATYTDAEDSFVLPLHTDNNKGSRK